MEEVQPIYDQTHKNVLSSIKTDNLGLQFVQNEPWRQGYEH